jgi:hypothetical protein
MIRMLMALALLLIGGAAEAGTCAALKAALADPVGGRSVMLHEDCAGIVVRPHFAAPVQVHALPAVTITGLTVAKGGGNLRWRGGTFTSAGGEEAGGPAGYAVNLIQARDVSISQARFVRFNRAIVGSGAERIAVRFNRFLLGQDGIIASGGADWQIIGNRFEAVSFKPSRCIGPDGSELIGLALRDCRAKVGWRFIDQWHQDGIQTWGGLLRPVIIGNVIVGVQQGIVDFGTKAWAGRQTSGALIAGNEVAVTGHHSVNFADSAGAAVIGNKATRIGAKGAPVRIPAGGWACGNTGQAGAIGEACE